jgi:DNA-binding response OmpR family regulator
VKGNPSVLLVDDDVDTREMYGWSLEARGFVVIGAGNVARAQDLASERRPDVIITDFTLPGEDGLALASRIRDSRILSDTPIVLVSGRAFVGDTAERALRLFDRVLVKPVLPDHLIGEIVPLMLDKTAAALERQLGDVRALVARMDHGSAARRVMAAVEEEDRRGASTAAALLADSRAHYIGANDAACALTGRSRAELLSLSVWDLTPEPDRAAGRQQWAQFVRTGSSAGAYHLAGPEGTPIEALFSAAAHVLPDCHLSLLHPLPVALTHSSHR